MTDEFNELYNMLAKDRDDIKNIKNNYEKDLNVLLGRIRAYHIEDLNTEEEYDLEDDFLKYKTDNIFLNYNLHNDATDYKISILQGYLQDLFMEKKFNLFRKEQEEKLSKNEYLEYIHNPAVRADKIAAWYQDFMQR